ncbi:MAG: hypothetical protein AAF152_18985 [Cyanobacteria bacterium P01_A01_bin.114]
MVGGAIAAEQELDLVRDLAARSLAYFITDDPVRLRQVLARH